MPRQIGDDTAFIADFSSLKEAPHASPEFPHATIKQLTQVGHMGAAD